MKLGPRFTFILSIVFVAGILASGFVLWEALQNRAEAEVTAKGQMLIDMMNAVRAYTGTEVSPLLRDPLPAQTTFISQTVPAFAAREVFEKFRKDPGYSAYFYREAATNPTNLRDKADDFETEVLARMRSAPTATSVSGFRLRDNEWVYYTAWPLPVSSESCLTCHGDPEQAPKSQLVAYGSENGFGWRLHDVVAAQMLYVPAEEVLRAARRSFAMVMAILVATLAAVLILVNLLLKRDVIQPLAVMADLSTKISADDMTSEDLESPRLTNIARRADELGQLAGVFRHMAGEILSRTQNLKQQVLQLAIEIDEAKRRKAVDQVVGSDFFRSLETQARALRDRRRQIEAGPPADEPSQDG